MLAISQKLKIGAMASVIAPYPTPSEISKRASGGYYTPSLFSPRTRANRPLSRSVRMTVKRFLPVVVLLACIGAAYAFGLHRFLTLDVLRDNRAALAAFVQSNYAISALAYMAIFIAACVPWGIVFTVIGATLGAAALFLIARSAPSATRCGPAPDRFSPRWLMVSARMRSTICCSFDSNHKRASAARSFSELTK